MRIVAVLGYLLIERLLPLYSFRLLLLLFDRRLLLFLPLAPILILLRQLCDSLMAWAQRVDAQRACHG
jgi:hypothetical protein